MLKRKESTQNTAVLNARILYYDFFSEFFVFDFLCERAELLLAQIKILKQEPIEPNDAKNFSALESEILAHGTKNIAIEYTHLFMLPFNVAQKTPTKKRAKRPNPQIVLYLSYYLDKTIAGVGLVRAKKLVAKSAMRLNEKDFRENEEHFGFLLVFMKYCLKNGKSDLAREVFSDLIAPMKDEIIKGIKSRQSANFAHVADLLMHFLDFESAVFGFTGVVDKQFH